MPYKKYNQSGFTLVEVLTVTVIIAALGLIIITLQSTVKNTQFSLWSNYLSVDDANNIVNTLARELRTAKPADTGAYLLETAEDQKIVFYSDIDFDGQTEKVRYQLSGNLLSKGVIKPSGSPISYPAENEKVKTLTALIQNGQKPIFYYYNGNWPADQENNPLDLDSRISDTRLIKISLSLNTQENSLNENFNIESFVQLRMLKDNL
jgi:prepilin-type N-terminal cleavage/methylation domain-containing protein